MVPASERQVDRGTRIGRAILVRLGAELRAARVERGLSIDAVAGAVGISNAEISRIERAPAPRVSIVVLARLGAVVGMDLEARLYPGGAPIRDRAHLQLLTDFRAELGPGIRWATEVPLPTKGDQRAWDAVVRGDGWRYGVEAETRPTDGQALTRRLALKQRDDDVSGVLLILRDTRSTRQFLREAAGELAGSFSVPGWRAVHLLRAGLDPGGSAVLLVPQRVAGSESRSSSRSRGLVTPSV